MKTLRFLGMTLLMVMLAVNFTACSKDDDVKIGTADDLVGKWTLTWTKGWELEDDGLKETWDEEDSGEDLIFTADGTGRKEEGASSRSFTWKLEDGKFTWDLKYDRTTRIIQLDAETLVLEITEEESQEINTYKRVSSPN